MLTVEVDEHWRDEIKAISDVEAADLNAVIDAALRRYVSYLRQRKIDQEREWYEANHPRIVERYLGEYVAVHDGEVVDADEDGTVLSKRVRQKFGRIPIAIIHVKSTT